MQYTSDAFLLHTLYDHMQRGMSYQQICIIITVVLSYLAPGWPDGTEGL